VGYDLRFTTLQEFRQLWSPHLSAAYMKELEKDIGKKGSKSRERELINAGITITFDKAWAVFTKETLSKHYDKTLKIYPSLSRLPDLCRSVLVSLVFNRGNSLASDSSDDRRREMRVIRDILAKADDNALPREDRKATLTKVENELISMQRLWPPRTGVYKRRQNEANLWRKGLQDWR
ncbi:hypothetical protein, partial [Photobacterium sp. OFAV2-7]|uniref:hypothetical protein n=1 Tax=Photobacterium sp. OFAV2-7 TaxID=2917748 RepID=UPI001EF5D7C0